MTKRKMIDPEKLHRIAVFVTERLRKEGVPHALIGGMAVAAYGYPRATADVDFLVSQDDLAKLTGRPLTVGVTEVIDGVRVDFIATEDGEDLLEGAIAISKGTPPLIPLPALVYLKLKANRRRDQSDVVELVKRGAVDLVATRWHLATHGAPDLLSDFEALVAIAEAEGD